jgi:hypothetical protein
MYTTFLNCTQHKLSAEQIAGAVAKYGDVPGEYRDFEPEIFARMANSPSDAEEIDTLATDFVKSVRGSRNQRVVIHLPLGSPALMFAVAQKIAFLRHPYRPTVVFSHSDRVSVDNGDGTKTVKFEFKQFIEM